MKKEFPEYRDSDGNYSFSIECEKEWEALPQSEKDLILKYLKLMKRFQKDPSKVGIENKRWLIENCDCKSWLAP